MGPATGGSTPGQSSLTSPTTNTSTQPRHSLVAAAEGIQVEHAQRSFGTGVPPVRVTVSPAILVHPYVFLPQPNSPPQPRPAADQETAFTAGGQSPVCVCARARAVCVCGGSCRRRDVTLTGTQACVCVGGGGVRRRNAGEQRQRPPPTAKDYAPTRTRARAHTQAHTHTHTPGRSSSPCQTVRPQT